MRALALLVSFALASFTDAIAQEQPLQPGQRVRVTAPGLDVNKLQTTFHEVRSDTLVLESMVVPLSYLARLEVSRGRKSNALKGLLIGSVVGVGVGAALGIWGASRPTSTSEAVWCYEGTAACAAVGGLVVGAAGGLVGLGIGALSKTERWEEVPLDRLRVSVVPQRGGFGIGARIVF
jgi:hypothetical protein